MTKVQKGTRAIREIRVMRLTKEGVHVIPASAMKETKATKVRKEMKVLRTMKETQVTKARPATKVMKVMTGLKAMKVKRYVCSDIFHVAGKVFKRVCSRGCTDAYM